MSLVPIEDEEGVDELDTLVNRVEEEAEGNEEDTRRTRAVEPRRVEEAKVGVALKEAALLTEGVCFEGVIREIYLGRYGDFRGPPRDERLRESWERRKDRMAYRIVFETPYGVYDDVIVISAHMNSRMVKLARCYDKFRVGMRVKVCIENGRPKISC